MDTVNTPVKFEFRSFTSSWDKGDWSFRWGLRTPNLREEEAVGVGDGTVRKSVGKFLWAIQGNFSSIFTGFRDIAAFVL